MRGDRIRMQSVGRWHGERRRQMSADRISKDNTTARVVRSISALLAARGVITPCVRAAVSTDSRAYVFI